MEIEGDSSLVINALRLHQIVNWKLIAKLYVALKLLEWFKLVTMNHILKEGNSKEYGISNMGANGIAQD